MTDLHKGCDPQPPAWLRKQGRTPSAPAIPRIRCFPICVVLFSSALFAGSLRAQTSYPMLMSLSPVAVQQGTSSEHTLDARYSMYGAYQVLVTGDGLTAEIVTAMEPDKDGREPSLTKIQLQFTATKDALPGVRDFRIVGPTGASTLGQVVVVRDPVITEDRNNDTPEKAQQISVPAAVCGTVEKSEDVDFYRFSVSEPARLNFHCRGMRLQDRIHDLQTHLDPIITIRNAGTGGTIASSDNVYAADPFLEQSLKPGDYLLEVRDVRYSGNAYWNYCIEISNRPFVSNVHPMVVTKGAPTELQLVGYQVPENTSVSWTAPGSFDGCSLDVRLPLAADVSNPVPVVLSDNAVVKETEADNNTPETAQAVAFPGTVAGRIETEADADCYVFEAAKGDRIAATVRARRYGSGLDSLLRILNAEGKLLTGNDDSSAADRMTTQDSVIENWSVPADGRYVLEVRDVHLRGGPEFVYSLEISRAVPYFELVLDSDKTWLTPGSSAALFVRANRRNGFDQAIQLKIEGLPEGVSAECGVIPAGKAVDGCIVLQAVADAAMNASNVRVTGTAVAPKSSAETAADDSAADKGTTTDADKTGADSESSVPLLANVAAQPMQETYMPGGGRSHWPVDMHTVAIGKPADLLQVKVNTHDVVLKPGGSQTIEVEIIRSAGFDKNVTLDMLFQHLSSKFANTLPEGVTIDGKNSQTLLTGKNSKGSITLTAAANAAAAERVQCCVMANVSINFVMKATYSSEPVYVSVAAAESQ
ncbi:MAG: PPC domain-containing protein [Planctomycetaceae bacterium]|nr:PPC domain-containing protein [Planctomycetaceae bacterium]